MSLVFPHTFVPLFRAVAPYIHAYRGKTFVVALAGEAIAAGKLNAFVQDLAILHAMGIKLVLVHGFRPQVTEQLAAKGQVSRFHKGIRVTDPVALDAAQEAAGQLRFEIEAAFSQGLPNTPMANAIVRVVSGNFLTARPVGIVDGVDFMHSGVVRKVDATAMRKAIDTGALVLLSPFGFSPTGEAFNLSMEDVATSAAMALQADKLLFITEIPGIHEKADDPESPIDTELALADAERLLAALPTPTQPSDPAFYLRHCVKACRAGVDRSHRETHQVARSEPPGHRRLLAPRRPRGVARRPEHRRRDDASLPQCRQRRLRPADSRGPRQKSRSQTLLRRRVRVHPAEGGRRGLRRSDQQRHERSTPLEPAVPSSRWRCGRPRTSSAHWRSGTG